MARKTQRYRVRTYEDVALGDWLDVVEDPTIYSEINNLSNTMTIILARNELSTPSQLFVLTTSTSRTMQTTTGRALAFFRSSGSTIGEDQPLNNGNKVKITNYTTSLAPLLTAVGGTKILTKAGGQPILVGSSEVTTDIFKGYVSSWDLDLGEDANIEVTMLSQASALSRTIYMNTDNVTSTPAYNKIAFNFNVQELSAILRHILNRANSAYGLEINHTAESVPDTGVSVNFTFEARSFSEAISELLALLPDQWYYYIDPHTDTFHLKERSTTADITLRRGVEVTGGNIRETIEHLVNQVLFIGGRSDDDNANTTHINYATDEDSQEKYGFGMNVITNDKVQTDLLSQLYIDSRINRFKEPLRDGEIEVVDTVARRTETYRVGQTVKLSGYGSLVGQTLYQIVAVDYHPDRARLRLNYLLPTVNKRLVGLQSDIGNMERRDALKA